MKDSLRQTNSTTSLAKGLRTKAQVILSLSLSLFEPQFDYLVDIKPATGKNSRSIDSMSRLPSVVGTGKKNYL
jgi:hypothetical protein